MHPRREKGWEGFKILFKLGGKSCMRDRRQIHHFSNTHPSSSQNVSHFPSPPRKCPLHWLNCTGAGCWPWQWAANIAATLQGWLKNGHQRHSLYIIGSWLWLWDSDHCYKWDVRSGPFYDSMLPHLKKILPQRKQDGQRILYSSKCVHFLMCSACFDMEEHSIVWTPPTSQYLFTFHLIAESVTNAKVEAQISNSNFTQKNQAEIAQLFSEIRPRDNFPWRSTTILSPTIPIRSCAYHPVVCMAWSYES